MKKMKCFQILFFYLFITNSCSVMASELVMMCDFRYANLSSVPCSLGESVNFYGGEGCDNDFTLVIYVANLSGYDTAPNQIPYSLPPQMPDLWVHLDSDFDGVYDKFIGPIRDFSHNGVQIGGSDGGTHFIFEHEINLMNYVIPFDPCKGDIPNDYTGIFKIRLVEKSSSGVQLYDLFPYSSQYDIISCDVFHETCGACPRPSCQGGIDPVYKVNICEDCFLDCNSNPLTNNYMALDNHLVEDNIVQKNSISPNPFQNEITIEFESRKELPVSIQVFNLNGVEVFKKRLLGIDGIMKEIVNLKDLSDGVYYCKLSVGDKTQTSKIIKIE